MLALQGLNDRLLVLVGTLGKWIERIGGLTFDFPSYKFMEWSETA